MQAEGGHGGHCCVSTLVDAIVTLTDGVSCLAHLMYWSKDVHWRPVLWKLLSQAVITAKALGVSLSFIILEKIKRNNEKYPIERSNVPSERGRDMPKHDEIAGYVPNSQYFVTKETLEANAMTDPKEMYLDMASAIPRIKQAVFSFAADRDWLGSYNNKMMSLSLRSEGGELCGTVEYCTGREFDWRLVNRVAPELADVVIYLFHVARVNDVDLEALVTATSGSLDKEKLAER